MGQMAPMNEIPALLVASFAGAVLGMIFFGGLWWTIRRGVASKSPAVWFIGSLLLRATVALSGVYWVSRGDWRRLLACLLGLLLARTWVMRITRLPGDAKTQIDGG
jgi:F1F0 ATPase subunit 2